MNQALELLFGSWTGILSLFVILFMVGMGYSWLPCTARSVMDPEPDQGGL